MTTDPSTLVNKTGENYAEVQYDILAADKYEFMWMTYNGMKIYEDGTALIPNSVEIERHYENRRRAAYFENYLFLLPFERIAVPLSHVYSQGKTIFFDHPAENRT